MDEKTQEALKNLTKEVRSLVGEKWGNRKRLSQAETWRKAVIYKDLVQVESLLKA